MNAAPASPYSTAPAPDVAGRLLDGARRALAAACPAEALPLLDRLQYLPEAAAEAMLLRGEALLGLHRLEEAERAADQACAGACAASGSGRRAGVGARADRPAAAHRLRARIRLARGRRDAAVDDAAAAVMAEPDDLPSGALLGAMLLSLQRFDEAIYFLGRAFQAAPQDPTAALQLAQAFLLAGRRAPAEELLAYCGNLPVRPPGLTALRAQSRLLAGDHEGAATLAAAGLAEGETTAALHSMLAHALVAGDRMAEAAPHFAAASRLAPGDGYLAHLAASSGAVASDRAADGYVACLFDGYAPRFEASLLGLGYRVPGLIRRAVERLPDIAAGGRLGPVLDLGCGTGLVGAVLADLLDASHTVALAGVDLSAAMLAQARLKGVYTQLHQAEIGAALASDPARYALITAADVFCYLGSLDTVLAACRPRLAPGGTLMFSVERLAPGQGWRLNAQGRYGHAPDYVRAALERAGLEAEECREEDLRLDGEHPVPGLFVLARTRVH